jgi:hypothetical protein
VVAAAKSSKLLAKSSKHVDDSEEESDEDEQDNEENQDSEEEEDEDEVKPKPHKRSSKTAAAVKSTKKATAEKAPTKVVVKAQQAKPSKSSAKSHGEAEAKENEDEDAYTIGSKADFKTGQKYPTPAPGMKLLLYSLYLQQKFNKYSIGNGDRVFYQTLLEQRPNSEIAQEWCLYYGVVNDEVHAEKLYKIVTKRKGKDLSSPFKKSTVVTSVKITTKSNKTDVSEEKPKKRSKKNVIQEDFDADTGYDKSSLWEGQGTSGVDFLLGAAMSDVI